MPHFRVIGRTNFGGTPLDTIMEGDNEPAVRARLADYVIDTIRMASPWEVDQHRAASAQRVSEVDPNTAARARSLGDTFNFLAWILFVVSVLLAPIVPVLVAAGLQGIAWIFWLFCRLERIREAIFLRAKTA